MDKSLKPTQTKRNIAGKKSKNDICPFTERPAGNRQKAGNDGGNLAAADLFSHFTANIIKENTLFTR